MVIEPPNVGRMRRVRTPVQAGLFGITNGATDRQATTAEAERILLDLADHIYTKTSLKPISKALFLASRCLLVVQRHPDLSEARALCDEYEALRSRLNGAAPEDDFDLRVVVGECAAEMPYLLSRLRRVEQLTRGTDRLGLAFDTLLRGKFESGEGLGTFLTPEEVVQPMATMLSHAIPDDVLATLGRGELLFGDVCGGTGRFVYALTRLLLAQGVPRRVVEGSARLFDQSRMAVDFGKLNFLFDDLRPRFACVADSLTASDVESLSGRFALIATNPPFGVGKYRWSSDLARALPERLLRHIGLRGTDDAADPSELFLFRNLDLLAPGGGLAIVLPDGLIQSSRFTATLKLYEQLSRCALTIRAIVSLPVRTFALGGTVAKTSFLVVTKDRCTRSLYVAVSHHLGFLKKGNRRAPDPKGNDLAPIAEEFRRGEERVGRFVGDWREYDRLVVPTLLASQRHQSRSGTQLGDLAVPLRTYLSVRTSATRHFHVSVLDVDETGLIDVLAALRNRPTTKGIACRPGDVLVSCINPRIWRVALVPDLPGEWSCSAEFVVLRPKRRAEGPRLALALHHSDAMNAVRALAGGTSSSRQRVPKEHVLSIRVPAITFPKGSIETYLETRTSWYRARLAEGEAFEKLHGGEGLFALNGEHSDRLTEPGL